MRKKKYLPLYYQWIKTGKLPHGNGLCNEFAKNDWFLHLFKPTVNEENYKRAYWAFEYPPGYPDNLPQRVLDKIFKIEEHNFTPLRQNIVLLMAAMNGEL